MYSNPKQLELFPELLHEAKLQDVVWDENARQLSCMFECLRMNIDGSKMQDTAVELRFMAVRKIATFYAPSNFEIRPSQVSLDSPITFSTLGNWNKESTEVVVSINSEHSLFDMQTSWHCNWLLDDELNRTHIERPYAHIHVEPERYSSEMVQENLYIEFEAIEIYTSDGSSLPLEQWGKEYQAFWGGWRSYWSKQSKAANGKDGEDNLNDEANDIFAHETNPYQNSSPFEIDNQIAPDYLLLPIRQYHFGLHQADWIAVAKAWPNFDQTNDERAEILKEDDFLKYSLVYLQNIDSWWEEENMACVKISGIQYWPPDEDGPAKEAEVVVSYGLRKAGNDWVIFTLSVL